MLHTRVKPRRPETASPNSRPYSEVSLKRPAHHCCGSESFRGKRDGLEQSSNSPKELTSSQRCSQNQRGFAGKELGGEYQERLQTERPTADALGWRKTGKETGARTKLKTLALDTIHSKEPQLDPSSKRLCPRALWTMQSRTKRMRMAIPKAWAAEVPQQKLHTVGGWGAGV